MRRPDAVSRSSAELRSGSGARRIMAPGSWPSGSPTSSSAAGARRRWPPGSELCWSGRPPRLRLLNAHQEQPAFALALDIEGVPGARRGNHCSSLGINGRHRHSEIVPLNPGGRNARALMGTLATESFGRPVLLECSRTLPGNAASRVLLVRGTTTMVASWLRLNVSPCATRTGRSKPGPDPTGSGRVAHQMSPWEITIRCVRGLGARLTRGMHPAVYRPRRRQH